MKKYTIFSIISILLIIGIVVAQLVPEIVGIQLYDAKALVWYNNNWVNSCTAAIGGTATNTPCLDTDGGYYPTLSGQIVGEFMSMSPTLVGNTTYWYATPNMQNVCALGGNEYCNINGNLEEVVCGSVYAQYNGAGFGIAFPNNVWTTNGEPTAVIEVNCAGYAQNNPQLNLQGICQNGACV